jgi:hypothetical protein
MNKSVLNKRVFKNTVLLIIELAGENGIGAVKLNKCLIISDALHQALYKESLTGASYIKHKYGPVLGKEAYNLLQKMIDSNDILVFDEMISPDVYENNHYPGPGVKASRELFTDEQINIVTWAVSTVMNMSARELSDVTHDRSYQKTPMFQEINLDDVYSWKIEESYDDADHNRLDEIIGKNLDVLTSLSTE